MTIKELRTSTGLSQAKFAKLLDIPTRTIEDWEGKRHKPPNYVVMLIQFYLENQPEK
jgi:DNA-binding transcriptional regulator YiaG